MYVRMLSPNPHIGPSPRGYIPIFSTHSPQPRARLRCPPCPAVSQGCRLLPVCVEKIHIYISRCVHIHMCVAMAGVLTRAGAAGSDRLRRGACRVCVHTRAVHMATSPPGGEAACGIAAVLRLCGCGMPVNVCTGRDFWCTHLGRRASW